MAATTEAGGPCDDPGGAPPARDAVARLRDRALREQSEGTIRRRPGDAARVVASVLLMVALSFHARSPTATERAMDHLFESLPDQVDPLFMVLYDLVGLWALGLLVATFVLVRRWRLARDLFVAGAAAWLLGRALAFFVQGGGLEESLGTTFQMVDTPRFPFVRLGMAVAMVVVAGPHLSRPVRRVGQGLVVALALSAAFLGRASANDLLAAVVLGWGVAAVAHYLFGTPVGRPSARQVGAALAQLGLPVTCLQPGPEQLVGRAVFDAEGADGPLRITAIGRDEADAQFLARAWRYLAYRDTVPMLLPTRRQQVEYEAYVALLARDSGVDTPPVLLAGTSGPLALLVERSARGVPLVHVAADEVTDELLDRLWHEVRLLRRARIAHGRLDCHHVFVDRGAPSIVGFSHASTNIDLLRSSTDTVELLATTGAIVGPERAVAAAVRGVGADAVNAALPVLQPHAVSGWTHDLYGGRASLDSGLERLRAAGASTTGTDPPDLRQLYRVDPRSLLMAVATLVGVGVLLSRVGSPAHLWHSIDDASWGWMVVAVVLGGLTDVAFGITFLGNVPIRLSVWNSIELQSALSFSNLAIPVAGDTALQVRFLQRNGLDLSSAVAAGGVLSTVSELAVQLALFFVAVWMAPDSIELGRIDVTQVEVIALAVVFGAGVAAAVLFGVRRLRGVVLPPVRRAASTMWSAVRSPSRLALLIVGNVVAHVLYAASLLACLYAFGAHVDLWTLLALNIAITTIASLVPLPGGGTAVSAVGLAGMLTALGVPVAASTAAVLSHELAVVYLPAIPGWLAMNDLVRRRLL